MKSAEPITHPSSEPRSADKSNAGGFGLQFANRPWPKRRIHGGLGRLAILLSCVLFMLSAVAGPIANPQSTPEQLVRQTSDQVLAKLRQEAPDLKAHPGKIYDLIKNIILPHFDFQRMGQWVLGVNWRRATHQQRDRFLTEFRDLLVNTYGDALLRYDNEQIRYLPTRSDLAKGEALVRTRIQQASGSSIPVDYRLYLRHGEWKVFDLSIDGVSMISNYRNSFTDQIHRIGLDGLIKRLEQHNQAVLG